jgi:hypothetical protein
MTLEQLLEAALHERADRPTPEPDDLMLDLAVQREQERERERQRVRRAALSVATTAMVLVVILSMLVFSATNPRPAHVIIQPPTPTTTMHVPPSTLPTKPVNTQMPAKPTVAIAPPLVRPVIAPLTPSTKIGAVTPATTTPTTIVTTPKVAPTAPVVSTSSHFWAMLEKLPAQPNAEDGAAGLMPYQLFGGGVPADTDVSYTEQCSACGPGGTAGGGRGILGAFNGSFSAPFDFNQGSWSFTLTCKGCGTVTVKIDHVDMTAVPAGDMWEASFLAYEANHQTDWTPGGVVFGGGAPDSVGKVTLTSKYGSTVFDVNTWVWGGIVNFPDAPIGIPFDVTLRTDDATIAPVTFTVVRLS